MIFNKDQLDLLLVMCPGWGVIQPPIGISYLKSFLTKHGIKVKCLDLSLQLYKVFSHKEYWDLNYPEHFIDYNCFQKDIVPYLGEFIEQWAKQIVALNPCVVGFSLFMSTINCSVLLAKRIKQLNSQIIIIGGGPEVTRIKRVKIDGLKEFCPTNQEFFSYFDVLAEGEGEETLREIMVLIQNKQDYFSVSGTLISNNGRITSNIVRPLIADLDEVPCPDFDDFNLAEYTRRAIPLVTSRGCVNRCTFCADSPLWKNYRCLSAERVCDDFRELVKKYCLQTFEITDSTINGNIRRLEKICGLLIDKKLDLIWSAKAACDKKMTYDLLVKLKQSGCAALSYGVESGSPAILKDMRKNTNIDEIERIIRDTHRVGIEANCFFLIGYPTETEDDFQMTLDFIKRNAAAIYRFDQVTGCHIEEDSHLGLNWKEYGIIFKEDGWYSRESNPVIRRERLARFKDLARNLHKHYKCEVQA